MRLTTRRAAAPVAIAVASILTLAACGGGDEDPATPEGGDTQTEPAPETEETESEEAPEETTSDDADETASDDAESESGDAESESGDADDAGASADGAAPWANPVTTDGESLGTIELGRGLPRHHRRLDPQLDLGRPGHRRADRERGRPGRRHQLRRHEQR
jgi:hypothetical protein